MPNSLVVEEKDDTLILYQDNVDSCDFWCNIVFFCCCFCLCHREFHYYIKWTFKKDGTIVKEMKHFRSDGDYKVHKTYKIDPTLLSRNPCYISTNVSESDCISFSGMNLNIPEGSNRIDETQLRHSVERINQFLAQVIRSI